MEAGFEGSVYALSWLYPPCWASRISIRPGGTGPRPKTWKVSAEHMSSPGRSTMLCSLGKLQCYLQREGSSLLGAGKLFVHFSVSQWGRKGLGDPKVNPSLEQ